MFSLHWADLDCFGASKYINVINNLFYVVVNL